MVLIALHVDDGLMTGCPKKSPKTFNMLKAKFEYGTWEVDDFRFTGRHISRGPDYSVIIDMDEYVTELQEIELSTARKKEKDHPVTERERTTLRGKLGELGWLARMLNPTLAFGVSRLQQRQTWPPFRTFLTRTCWFAKPSRSPIH